jgi:hypothetical protein
MLLSGDEDTAACLRRPRPRAVDRRRRLRHGYSSLSYLKQFPSTR